MSYDQSSLGQRTANVAPEFSHDAVGRVIETKNFDRYGLIEVKLLDGSDPKEVWVMNNVDREPVIGDHVIIGWLFGRKDAPYVQGFLDDSYMRNFIQVKKDLIRLQLPVFDIGVIDGISHDDVKKKLLDDNHRDNRAMIELTPKHLLLQFPTTPGNPPARIEILPTGRIIVQSRETTQLDPES